MARISLETENNIIFLLANHPYVKNFSAWIVDYPDGRCCVKWRDYGSTKQERYFPSRKPAMKFLRDLYKNKNKIYWDDSFGITLEECDKFWRDLDGK